MIIKFISTLGRRLFATPGVPGAGQILSKNSGQHYLTDTTIPNTNNMRDWLTFKINQNANYRIFEKFEVSL